MDTRSWRQLNCVASKCHQFGLVRAGWTSDEPMPVADWTATGRSLQLRARPYLCIVGAHALRRLVRLFVHRKFGPTLSILADARGVSVNRHGSGTIVGKNWVSEEYGITVHSEMDVLSPQTGIVTGLAVEEFTDIQIGVALDSGEFVVPTGYQKLAANRSR